MSILDIILIGIVLALDACAVTIANCTTYANVNKKFQFAMAICFAVCQFLMPVIGFYIGGLFAEKITGISKYITAGIFFLLAGKIIIENVIELVNAKKESASDKENKHTLTKNNLTIKMIILQGIATSIDALAIGVSFTLSLTMNVFLASGIIGLVTFLLVYFAIFFGKLLSGATGEVSKWLGAGILLFIAFKSLFF